MSALLPFLFVIMLQTSLPGLPNDLPLSPPATTPGQTTTTPAQSRSNPAPVIPAATDAEIAHAATIAAPAGMDSGATSTETGLHKLATQSLEMPNYLLGRDKNIILGRPEVQTLNDSLRYVGLGLWIICIAMIIVKHLAGPLAGVDIMDLSIALPLGLLMGILGWFNKELLSVIIDLAGAVIAAVANSTLKTAITPGLSFNTATQAIIGPLLGIAYDLLAIWLIFKMWLQLAWLWILTTVAPIYITITGAPFLGQYGSHWWQNWFSTLIDPILTVAALRLVIPWFDILQGAPDLGGELLKAVTLFVVISTIGWHRGAYRPHGVDALIAVGLWRMLKTRHAPTATAATPAIAPPQPPNNPHGLSGQGFSGSGGGTASSWWKTGQWAVGNSWVPQRQAASA
jgi:hypothetical protein